MVYRPDVAEFELRLLVEAQRATDRQLVQAVTALPFTQGSHGTASLVSAHQGLVSNNIDDMDG